MQMVKRLGKNEDVLDWWVTSCLLIQSVVVKFLPCGGHYLGTGIGWDLFFGFLLGLFAWRVSSLGLRNIWLTILLLAFVYVMWTLGELLSCPFGCSRALFFVRKIN